MNDTQKSLGLIWSIVGVTTFYISLNICFFMHGSEFFLPSIKLGKTDYYSASFYGIFFTMPSILTNHYLTMVYAKNYSRKHWVYCFPVAFNRDFSDLPNFLKNYQVFFFVIFLILPSLLHFDFVSKFFHGTVYIESSKQPILVGWDQFTLDFSIYKYGINNFKFGDVNNGIDYYPIILPIGVIIMEFIHICSFIATIISIGKKKS